MAPAAVLLLLLIKMLLGMGSYTAYRCCSGAIVRTPMRRLRAPGCRLVVRDGCDALGVKVGEHKEIIEAGRAADIYRWEGSISGASETTLENAERWRVGEVQNVLARRVA